MSNFVKKAGVIPFHFKNGVLRMLFMISSDPMFGGPRPMISKGTIEVGELEMECALREGHEELGLVSENILCAPFEIFRDHVVLRSGEYDLVVYGVAVADPDNFVEPGHETAYTRWMTYEEFMVEGRRDHKPIVSTLAEAVVQ